MSKYPAILHHLVSANSAHDRPCDLYKYNLHKVQSAPFYQKAHGALLIRDSLNSQITFLKNAAPKSIHHLDQSMLTAPECDQFGKFKPIQCTRQHCCCVDPRTGQPVKHTTTSKSQMKNLYCNYSFPTNCTAYTFNCTKCQKTVSESV